MATNPALTVHLESGDDAVIIEGMVAEVTDRASLAAVDAAYHAKYGISVGEAGNEVVWYVLRPETAYAWLESDSPTPPPVGASATLEDAPKL